jgi:hypothetical protein
MQFMSSGFNNFLSEWFNSCANVSSSRDAKKFINPFKYAYVLVYCNKCNMKFVNSDFNILKVNPSTLLIENMWKKSLIHFNINLGFQIITCYGKCKMQLLNNGLNMLKVDGSTHVPC